MQKVWPGLRSSILSLYPFDNIVGAELVGQIELRLVRQPLSKAAITEPISH